jgi:hypothetical protein
MPMRLSPGRNETHLTVYPTDQTFEHEYERDCQGAINAIMAQENQRAAKKRTTDDKTGDFRILAPCFA